MSDLRNKVVFLTGGAGGIGAACTTALLAQGAKVFAVQRSLEKLEMLQSALNNTNLDIYRCDITDEQQVMQAFTACNDQLGPVDVLINNAGIGIPTPDLSQASTKDFRTMFDVNVLGAFLCTREALRQMKPRGSGHIVNIISQAGTTTNPTAPLYCASKHGQRGLSGGTADQILGLGIKVTDLNPAAVDTAYWGDRPVARDKFLKPDDVAQALLFILQQPENVLIRQLDLVSMNQKK